MGRWLRTFRHRESAVAKLDGAIFQASLACAEVVKPELEQCPERERQTKWMYALFESIYFFMHLTVRTAVGKLGEEKTAKLQETLGPLSVDSTVESLFKHWPPDMRERIRGEFYENLNKAEIEYSECTELMTEGQPFSDAALISRFANNVAKVIERPYDPALLMGLKAFVVVALGDMRLDDLVAATAKEL